VILRYGTGRNAKNQFTADYADCADAFSSASSALSAVISFPRLLARRIVVVKEKVPESQAILRLDLRAK
jgi:hypothetical protein